MNEYHSCKELLYKKRWITPHIRAAIENFPVDMITGARQVGKSTPLQNEFKDFKYVSLDDFSTLQQARTYPVSLWTDTDRLIIDEAHKAPELFAAIKLKVDATKREMRFIVSGSSNMLLMKRISETLAGRAVYFEMYPMTCSEMGNMSESPERFFDLWKPSFEYKESLLSFFDPVPVMLKGFMPSLLTLTKRRDVLLWWEGYIKTYLERIDTFRRICSMASRKSSIGSMVVVVGIMRAGFIQNAPRSRVLY